MNNSIPSTREAKPFVKWAGGKSLLLPEIIGALPRDFHACKLCVEPFVGGGALFFHLKRLYPHKSYVINDHNSDLVHTYEAVRDAPGKLIGLLRVQQQRYDSLRSLDERRAYFLRQRELFNGNGPDKLEKSALLIFLNKTCFNGLFRVNSSGRFNVSFGKRISPLICDESTLLADSRLLQGVQLVAGDYAGTGRYIAPGSFFYLDPPYRPVRPSASFAAYTRAGFNDDEQYRLRLFCDSLHHQGVRWMLSNSDGLNCTPADDFLDRLYASYPIARVTAHRNMGLRQKKNTGVADRQLPAA